MKTEQQKLLNNVIKRNPQTNLLTVFYVKDDKQKMTIGSFAEVGKQLARDLGAAWEATFLARATK